MAHGKKTGGRQAGTPNKVTAQLRERLQTIIETTVEQLPDLLDQMPVEDRVRALTALLPYVLPKLSNVEIGGTDVPSVIWHEIRTYDDPTKAGLTGR